MIRPHLVFTLSLAILLVIPQPTATNSSSTEPPLNDYAVDFLHIPPVPSDAALEHVISNDLPEQHVSVEEEGRPEGPQPEEVQPKAFRIEETEEAASEEAVEEGAEEPQSGPVEQRVWVTFYCLSGRGASGRYVEPGHAAAYPIYNNGAIVGAYIPGIGTLPWGSKVDVEGVGEVGIYDTGWGMPDGRPWLDVKTSSCDAAVRGGAGWRRVQYWRDR